VYPASVVDLVVIRRTTRICAIALASPKAAGKMPQELSAQCGLRGTRLALMVDPNQPQVVNPCGLWWARSLLTRQAGITKR
jgi:hypothetical protein